MKSALPLWEQAALSVEVIMGDMFTLLDQKLVKYGLSTSWLNIIVLM